MSEQKYLNKSSIDFIHLSYKNDNNQPNNFGNILDYSLVYFIHKHTILLGVKLLNHDIDCKWMDSKYMRYNLQQNRKNRLHKN